MRSKWSEGIIGADNSLTLTRWQAFSWITDDQDLWCIMAWLESKGNCRYRFAQDCSNIIANAKDLQASENPLRPLINFTWRPNGPRKIREFVICFNCGTFLFTWWAPGRRNVTDNLVMHWSYCSLWLSRRYVKDEALEILWGLSREL